MKKSIYLGIFTVIVILFTLTACATNYTLSKHPSGSQEQDDMDKTSKTSPEKIEKPSIEGSHSSDSNIDTVPNAGQDSPISNQKGSPASVQEKGTSNPKAAEVKITPAPKNNPEPTKAGTVKGKVAYLTFDDFPSQNTIKILDTLKKYGIKATFFPNVDAKNVEFTGQMIKRMVQEGHTVGNHTYSHDYAAIYSSVANYIADTDKLNDFIYKWTSIRPTLLRYPGGSANHSSWSYGGKTFMDSLIPKMKSLGYEYCDWNVSSGDASTRTAQKDIIIQNVLKGAKSKDKAIILMHESEYKTTTAEALPEIIDGLKAMGFKFDKLSSSSYVYHFKR